MLSTHSLFSQVVYQFPTVTNPAGCPYSYDISISIKLDSVSVTNIYFDDGTTGSFAFQTHFSYTNIFSNSTLPAGTFYTYEMIIFSDNPNLNQPSQTNNVSGVPLETGSAGNYRPSNNPTYNSSASALGLVLGGVYTSPTILNTLGYDSAVIHINLPCLDTTMSTDNNLLPVLWSPLQVAVVDKQVTLSWQTYTEQQNAGFSIERSTDGRNWTKIGFVLSQTADGNSSTILSYSFSETLPGNNQCLYRVIQHDLDGNQAISNIARLRPGGASDRNSITVFPNPTAGKIRLSGVNSNTPFNIYDNNGRLLQKGLYQQYIQLQVLKPGVYWIQVQQKAIRFVVQ